MLVKIVLAAVVFATALVFAQREDVVHRWGVAGSCESVRAPVDDGNAWYACKEGLHDRLPELDRRPVHVSVARVGLRVLELPRPGHALRLSLVKPRG